MLGAWEDNFIASSSCSSYSRQAILKEIQFISLNHHADPGFAGPGAGLAVEARKRVTIGVELAAKVNTPKYCINRTLKKTA